MAQAVVVTLPSRRLRWTWWSVGIAALAIGLFVYGHRAENPPPAPLDTASHRSPPLIQPTPARSLDGTTPDGALHDGRGELVLSRDLIRRFDYWLTAYGEKPIDAIKADILADLRRELGPASLARAAKLLDAYLAYKTELARLTPMPSGLQQVESLAQQLQAMRQVRSRHFSQTEIAQLFGPDDAQDDDTLARLRIMQDRTLNEADKAARLKQLTAQLSPEQQAHRTEPTLHLSVTEAVAEARARGASADEIQAIRTGLVGAEAAQRLAQLDQDEAAWQARVQQYQHLLQTDAAAAEAYQRDHFTDNEKLRLSAYAARRP